MKRPEVSDELHRQARVYAATRGLSIPDAYEELLKKGLDSANPAGAQSDSLTAKPEKRIQHDRTHTPRLVMKVHRK